MARFFLLLGPSGVGKRTLMRLVLQAISLKYLISHVTRSPRPGEINGEYYHFRTVAQFKDMVSRDLFLEWAEYPPGLGKYYGTTKEDLIEHLTAGLHTIKEMECQGALKVMNTKIELVRQALCTIAILPPKPYEENLRLRLLGRGDTIEDADARIRQATEFEIPLILSGKFDHIVTNYNQQSARAADEITEIILREAA